MSVKIYFFLCPFLVCIVCVRRKRRKNPPQVLPQLWRCQHTQSLHYCQFDLHVRRNCLDFSCGNVVDPNPAVPSSVPWADGMGDFSKLPSITTKPSLQIYIERVTIVTHPFCEWSVTSHCAAIF